MMIIDQEKLVDNIIVNDIVKTYPELKKLIKNCSPYEVRGKILSVLDPRNDLHYDYREFHELNLECDDLTYLDEITTTLRNYVRVADVEQKAFAEVMTPIWLVEEMLDTLPSDVWTNKDLKWLDPCAGVGTFYSIVVQRLMKGLKKVIPNKNKRYRHIIENMLFACELQAKNMFIYHCIYDRPNIFEMNTFYGSFLTDEFDTHMKEVWGVEKFDIVIGNPPYQEMDGGYGASAKPMYNTFTEKSISISNQILFITPSRWFAGGKGLDKFRKMMLSSNKIKLIQHFDNATNVFGNNVSITGGVSYFLFDNNYNGKCFLNNSETQMDKYDIVVDIKNYSLLEKVLSNYNSLSTICLGRGDNTFGIQTNDKRFSDVKLNDNFIKCYVSKNKGFEKWIDKTKITQHELINKNKVITAGANGSSPKFGNKFIGETNSVCSGSYIWFVTNSKKESSSLVSYMNCKFSNYLLSLRKISQHIKADTCKWIPLVPFDREWTDEQLYSYFNLSQEEINLIETQTK